MTNPNTSSTRSATSRTQPAKAAQPVEHTNLSYRYGTIGIQAVAAAARYSGVRTKSASASAGTRIDQRFVESAV